MSRRIRQFHRWVSMAFTLTVVVCFVTLTGVLPFWVFYLPLLPLTLLMASGLYLFALPYTARSRSGQRAATEV
ncbi:hypothetical protein [Pseudonocardia kunmingensis]|uniref:Uncharacterized protein n=1 Tax=Pseudonocardia kunmingensis TaxID=630975 RepID=A0A543D3B7_9PSEU|nr:hypothetical protein [Pseudonocardia kunmingensis]TQM03835.1 hypothetical protein FB558_6860 [Pseudonocardia kunmingensis]